MTILRRFAVSAFLVLSALMLLPAAASAQGRPPIVDQLAKTYGLPSFGQVDAIRFTFNAQLPGISLSRTWTWETKTDRVTFEGKDKAGQPVKVTYLRSKLDGQSADIEANFTNDQYWLLLPFHFVWDGGAMVQDAGKQPLPDGKGSAEKIVMKYPSQGGYSPGDTWELYVGADGRVQEMVFRRGGDRKPGLVIARWANYKKAGPVLFALDHPGTADGKPLHVTFSNVAVRLTGSTSWTDAK